MLTKFDKYLHSENPSWPKQNSKIKNPDKMILRFLILILSVLCDQRLTSCGTKVTDENQIIDVIFMIEYGQDHKEVIESLKS